MQILCFGHSMVYGLHDSEGGWVQRLRRKLEEKYKRKEDIEVYNLGIPDNDSNQLLERFEKELEDRVYKEDPVVIVQIGANDSQRIEGDIRVPKKDFMENIKEIVSITKEKTGKALFVGETFIESDLEIPDHPEIDISNEKIEEYNETVKKTYETENIDYLDVREHIERENGLKGLKTESILKKRDMRKFQN